MYSGVWLDTKTLTKQQDTALGLNDVRLYENKKQRGDKIPYLARTYSIARFKCNKVDTVVDHSTNL